MVVGLLGVFLALDGPATAARLIDGRSIAPNSIRSRQIRDRTLTLNDLSSGAVATLMRTPDATITARQLAARAVENGKIASGAVDSAAVADGTLQPVDLAAGAVTADKLANDSVGSAAVADGSLQATDIGDFYGTVSIDFKPFKVNDCQVAKVDNPRPTRTPAQIADDIIMVSPAAAGFTDLIALNGTPGAGNTLRILACRIGRDPADPDNPDNLLDPPPTNFQYVGVDGP